MYRRISFSLKLTASLHLKMDGWKMTLPFGMAYYLETLKDTATKVANDLCPMETASQEGKHESDRPPDPQMLSGSLEDVFGEPGWFPFFYVHLYLGKWSNLTNIFSDSG